MWQICGHVPQSLLVLNDITFRAAQLSVSFFMETFIHAKEKVYKQYSVTWLQAPNIKYSVMCLQALHT